MAVPRLRFRGFKNEWLVAELGDLLKIGSGRDYKHLKPGKIPVFGTGGLITHVDRYLYDGKSVGIGRKGTIDKPQFLNGKFWTVDTLFYTYNHGNNIPEFLYLIFQKINWKRYNEASGVPSLSKSTIEKIKIAVPESKEQEKIAEFLTIVDERIDKLQRKVELLKQYKKGAMQQIFSQRIRFKNESGDLYPDWRFKKAGELFSNISNKQHNGDLPVLSVTQDGVVRRDQLDRKIEQSNEGVKGYKIIEPNDFVISLRSFQGGIERSSLMGISSPAYTVLRSKPGVISEMFQYYFKREVFVSKLASTVVGIRDGKQISYEPFSIIRLPLPSEKEQQKIAIFLSSIDEKISRERDLLTALKTWRKGLMQRMIV